MTKTIVQREIRFATHIPRRDYREDAHYVKEQVHYSDGSIEPRTFLVKDYERPVWVTKEALRNHKEKKEFELIENTTLRKTTESDLNLSVAGMLSKPYLANQPNQIKDSPHVYGYDQTSTSLIKLKSLQKNQFIQTDYTVAIYDIETDISTREILLSTIVFKNKVHVATTKAYVKQKPAFKESVMACIDKYLPHYQGKLKVDITIHDTEVDMLKASFATANKWAPDFLAIWNMNFDIPRVLERLEVHKVNPVDVLCDTSIPRPYRICQYKQGINKKVTASGVVKPIPPSLQWHSLKLTASFYVIDAMCVYRQIRIAKQEEPSYGLDFILKKVIGKGKLKIVNDKNYTGAKWHTYMQTMYPVEYTVYNIFDCLGVLELDAVTKDLCQVLPSGAGMTDFAKFNSNPKKISDALFLFGLERGRIIGTPAAGKFNDTAEVPDELLEDVDEGDEEKVENYKGLSLAGWIQLLPQNHLLHEGLKCLEDFPEVITSVRGLTWDLDAKAAYPTGTLVSNMSKATCLNELISIEGVTESCFREQNLSVCLGGVNTLEYFNVMFNMPSIADMDELIDIMCLATLGHS